MQTEFNPRHLLERHFDSIEHSWDTRDAQLYALGIGMGSDPVDQAQLRYVYEGVDGELLKIFPTFANVLSYPGFWAREPDTGIDWKKVVHAEQQVILHAPLPSRGRVIGQTHVSALWDKGPGRGALMQQKREIRDTVTGRLLATLIQLSLLRGNGGFGPGGNSDAPPAPHQIPLRAPDAVCELPTQRQTALIYRLSGDLNPLHADPAVAGAAGFERPILHGMATMGVAAHAVLRTVMNYEEMRFAGMRVRFTAPALPGDTLRTEMWIDGKVVSVRTSAIERGVVVLDNARVDMN